MLIMENSKQIASQLTYLQDQKLLTLCWRLFSECGCDHVNFPFTYKAADTLVMDNSQQRAFQLTY